MGRRFRFTTGPRRFLLVAIRILFGFSDVVRRPPKVFYFILITQLKTNNEKNALHVKLPHGLQSTNKLQTKTKTEYCVSALSEVFHLGETVAGMRARIRVVLYLVVI